MESQRDDNKVSVDKKFLGDLRHKMEQLQELERFRTKNQVLFDKLSPRERQTLKMVANGLTNSEIAERLELSRYTVENHRKSIKSKLEANTFTDLYKFALAFEVIEFGNG